MRVIDNGNALAYLKKADARVWLVICGGTMRGVHGGGVVSAFEERGLTERFAGVVGVSTGAPTAAYFLAGQAALGTSIYYEECTTPNFLSLRRALRGGDFGDVQYLANVFKCSAKKLDEPRIRASASELFFGITEYASASERYLDAKSVPYSIVHGIHVSIAMPAVYREHLYVDTVRHNDGAVACMPIRFALSRKPDAIVILANCAENHTESWKKRLLTNVLMLRENKNQRRMMRSRYARVDEEYRDLEASGIPHAIFYSDPAIGSYTRDPALLKHAAMRARIHALQSLDNAGVL